MIDKPYTIVRTCRTCRGRGTVVAPRCLVCGQAVHPDDPWWEAEGSYLPCGHPEMALQLEVPCAECEGNGRVTQALGEREWWAYRQRRRLRWVFVIALSLLFLTAMSFVIAREPDLLCGNIWYGVIFVTITARLADKRPDLL